ncbi:hypothetical protein WQ54_26160 [Bacillus sp. SA1-12]|uniref:hypothetical protein n=1 Tax=Bacillus sp. SA1-12 TaxID=1455638 RepID=UPI00062721E9|nr:hypothetical protein [Bacillus sp. SA1-12]KKI89364.1 hypothetical protein WQ54_26160 [Bacillus sp. SA1-12]
MVNEGSEQTGNSVTISKDGSHVIHYWSLDKAGNQEEKKAVEIQLDQTAPTITFSAEDDIEYSADQVVNISCKALDELSTIASSICKDLSTPAYQLGLSTHTMTAAATDLAGNNASKSIRFIVTVDYESLVILTKQFLADKEDKATSYINKLKAAKKSEEKGNIKARDSQINAYIKLVSTKGSKDFNKDQAEVLLRLAQSLKK